MFSAVSNQLTKFLDSVLQQVDGVLCPAWTEPVSNNHLSYDAPTTAGVLVGSVKDLWDI